MRLRLDGDTFFNAKQESDLQWAREKNIEPVYLTEWWMFLVPNKELKMRMPVSEQSYTVSPSYFCTENLSFDAFKLLCNSIEDVKIESLGQSSSQKTSKRATVPLERLPAELLGMVFVLLDPEEFMALGLSSQTLWNRAISWAQNAYLHWRNAYSWAGSPLICVGSDLMTLPPSIYEMFPETVPIELPDTENSEERRYERKLVRPRVWYDEVTARYVKTPFPSDGEYPAAFSKHINSADIPESLHGPMKVRLPSFSIELGSKWYLRNLTKREYIQMEGVITEAGDATVAFLGHKWLTLDILLLWLITWRGEEGGSTWDWETVEEFEGFSHTSLEDTYIDPTYGPLDDSFWPMWHGPWAGHSLDVVTERELDTAWPDRTTNIRTLAPKVRRLFCGHSMSELGSDCREYWEERLRECGDFYEVRLRQYISNSEYIIHTHREP